MKSIALVLALALTGPVARAQDFNMNMQVGPNGIAVTTKGAAATGEGYSLAFEPNAEHHTLFKVVSPEGAQCQVWDGKKVLAEEDIPMSFSAEPDKFYRFVVKLQNGMVWEKKLSAKRHHTGTLSVAPPTATITMQGSPPPFAPQPPMPFQPPPAFAGPAGMSDADFAALKGAIEGEGFPKQKVDVLRTASGSAVFTVAQVGELIDLYAFPDDKVRVVEITKDRMADRQNAYQLYSHFAFPNDKEKVKRLLGQ